MKAPRTTPSALLFFAALALSAAPLLAARDARAQQPPVVIVEEVPSPSRAQARPTPTPTTTRPATGQAPTAGINAPVAAATPRPTRAPATPLAGRVVGDAGEPLAGVPVFASSRAPGGNTRAPTAVTTDEAGNFVFPSLAPGLYFVGASVPGYVFEIDSQTGRAVNTFRPGDNAVVRMFKGGVITGAVIDQQGEPLVALSVRALRVRDLEGRTPQASFPFSAEDRTDDRGVYRIYGLLPGVYLIFAGGYSSTAFGPATAYGGDVPTFYPSGTSDTAAEVTVRGGQETAGIDIRYRDEQGHRVTGTVDFPAPMPPESGIGITLVYTGTGMPAGSAGVSSASAAADSSSALFTPT